MAAAISARRVYKVLLRLRRGRKTATGQKPSAFIRFDARKAADLGPKGSGFAGRTCRQSRNIASGGFRPFELPVGADIIRPQPRRRNAAMQSVFSDDMRVRKKHLAHFATATFRRSKT